MVPGAILHLLERAFGRMNDGVPTSLNCIRRECASVIRSHSSCFLKGETKFMIGCRSRHVMALEDPCCILRSTLKSSVAQRVSTLRCRMEMAIDSLGERRMTAALRRPISKESEKKGAL